MLRQSLEGQQIDMGKSDGLVECECSEARPCSKNGHFKIGSSGTKPDCMLPCGVETHFHIPVWFISVCYSVHFLCVPIEKAK